MANYGTLDTCAAQVGERHHVRAAIGFLKAVLDGSYSAERDVALYKMPADGSKLILRPGLAAILFPEDGHAPLQAPHGTPAPSRRIVVKVRLA
jgi:beta-galactosidase beta subunit